MFAYLVEVLPGLFPDIEFFTWNYTEAGHGKGPVDGIGCRPKAKADSVVAHGKDVDTFEKSVACAKSLDNVIIDVVLPEHIEEMRKKDVHSQRFNGTMSAHQLTWSRSSPLILFFNRLSCFQCLPGSKCHHYHMGTLDFSVEEDQIPNPDDSPITGNVMPVPAKRILKNDWVKITLSGRPYPG